MKLSMSLLSWYMRDFDPICHIESDELCIQGMRFVMDDVDKMQPEMLYFGNAEFFFTAPQYAGAYLIVNRHSILIFRYSEYNELLNKLLSAFDFFNQWEAQLIEASSRNAPLSEFIPIIEPVLTNPFVIGNMDRSFSISSDLTGHHTDPLWENAAKGFVANHPAMYAPYFDSTGTKIKDLSEEPVLVRNVYPGGAPVMMFYMKQQGEIVASVGIIQEFPAYTEMNSQLVPVLARYCTKALEFTSVSGAIQSASNIMRNLAEGTEVGPLNLERLGHLLPAPPWRFVIIRFINRTDQLALRALQAELRTRSGILFPVIHQEECICLSTPFGLESLQDYPGISMGASMLFSDLDSIFVRRQQAEFALSQASGAEGIYLCENYACDYLLRVFRQMNMTMQLLHPAFEALTQYDQDNSTDLRNTLHVYLHYERNQLLTAKAMHIHPNTMRYRLQRIMEIAGLTLENPEELKYLRLSDWLQTQE